MTATPPLLVTDQVTTPRSPPLRDPLRPPHQYGLLLTFHPIVLFFLQRSAVQCYLTHRVLLALYCLSSPRHHTAEVLGSTGAGTSSACSYCVPSAQHGARSTAGAEARPWDVQAGDVVVLPSSLPPGRGGLTGGGGCGIEGQRRGPRNSWSRFLSWTLNCKCTDLAQNSCWGPEQAFQKLRRVGKHPSSAPAP